MKALQPGDHIALIAPARAVSKDEMSAFRQWCADKALILQEGKNLYGKNHQFSGTAEERAQDLREAWTNPEIKAIFCARGGYGSVQLLDHLQNLDWTANPKWLVGFSDITTLHLHLNNLGIPSIHGPMAIHWGIQHEFTEENIAQLERLLFNLSVEINTSNSLISDELKFNGELIGGNLSLVYASLGTPEQPNTDGKVLFLEDLDEYLYHIDRMMVALKRAGVLKNPSALLIGGMTDMKDNAIPFGKSAKEIILEHADNHQYPVIFDFPAGHTQKNACFMTGAYCTFEDGILKQQL